MNSLIRITMVLPESLQNLQKYFEKFPGVGPRQASRFAFFILKQPKERVDEFVSVLQNLSQEVALCSACYLPSQKNSKQCKICTDKNRDQNTICVVEKEQDAINLEKMGVHNGIYLVLGENISPIEVEENTLAKNRIKELVKNSSDNQEKKEIVLALNNTREGNFTSMYIREMFRKNNLGKLKLTSLGRGLSTGSELEYADEETLRNALKNRN